MGCAASQDQPHVDAQPHDAYAAAPSILSDSMSSDGVESPEPDPLEMQQYLRCLVSHARRRHGITSDLDQFAPTESPPSPQQLRTVELWIDETTTAVQQSVTTTASSFYLGSSVRSDVSVLSHSVTLPPGAVDLPNASAAVCSPPEVPSMPTASPFTRSLLLRRRQEEATLPPRAPVRNL
jgi:hypothetical protein